MSVATLGGTLSVPLPDRIANTLPAASEPRAASIVAGRNEAIDAIRVFAAAGIVFVHAAESPVFDKWGNLFRFGVPFFLFASFYFQSQSLRRNADRPMGRFIMGRFQ